ncbi:MAG: hypothetical protein P8008_03680 [Gammaproteobacteria bacterium]
MSSNGSDHRKEAPGASLRRTLVVSSLIALAGAAALLLIFNTEPEAERETAVRQSAMLVDVVTPEGGSFRPVIEALGVVRPSRALELRPRVGGQVVELSSELEPGGFVREGEVLQPCRTKTSRWC